MAAYRPNSERVPTLILIYIFLCLALIPAFGDEDQGFGKPTFQRYDGEFVNVKGYSFDDKIDYRKAESALSEKIQSEPNDWQLHYNLGTLYLRDKKFDQAIAELKNAKELNPKEILPRVNLAAAYREKGMYTERMTELREALGVDPRNGLLLLNAGIACVEHEFVPNVNRTTSQGRG